VDTLIVQLPDTGTDLGGSPGTPRLLSLGPGQVATFGRGSAQCATDIEIVGEGVSRHAGEIAAIEDHWRLSNLSRSTTYVVENLEGAGEYVKVAPGRIGAPIPFELSRILLPLTAGFVQLRVFAPQHTYLAPGSSHAAGEYTVTPFALDPTAKYFLVLLALCEPRLRDPSSVAIPNVGEVAARLRPLPECAELTASAVNYHIDYLAGSKLRVRERTGTEELARLDWKREAVVAMALRFNLVREEQLSMLPSRHNAGRAQ
jgi:serine/threonine-protein kinase